jgi:hypothetical protein
MFGPGRAASPAHDYRPGQEYQIQIGSAVLDCDDDQIRILQPFRFPRQVKSKNGADLKNASIVFKQKSHLKINSQEEKPRCNKDLDISEILSILLAASGQLQKNVLPHVELDSSIAPHLPTDDRQRNVSSFDDAL